MNSFLGGLLWVSFLAGAVLFVFCVRGEVGQLDGLPVGTPLIASLVLVAGAAFSLTAHRKRFRRQRNAERRQKAGAERDEQAFSREERLERISSMGSSRRAALVSFGVPLIVMIAASIAYVTTLNVTNPKSISGWVLICVVAPTLLMAAIHEPLMILGRRLGGLFRFTER